MTLIIPRRRFLIGIASALAAPVIARVESIMPTRAIRYRAPLVIFDGRNDYIVGGDLADVWFEPGVYYDFSVDANRRKWMPHPNGNA